MPPAVDLVVVFNADSSKTDAPQTLAEYTHLIEKLNAAGLNVAGKKGSRRGQLVICIVSSLLRFSPLPSLYSSKLQHCPSQKVAELLQRETSVVFLPRALLDPDVVA